MTDRSPSLDAPRTSAARIALGRDPTDLEMAILDAAWGERRLAGSLRPLLDALPAAGGTGGLRAGRPGTVALQGGAELAVCPGLHGTLDALDPGAAAEAAAETVERVVGEIVAAGARPTALLGALSAPADVGATAIVADAVRGAGEQARAAGCELVAGQVELGQERAVRLAVFAFGVAAPSTKRAQDDAPGRDATARAPAPGDAVRAPAPGDAVLLLIGTTAAPAGLGRAATARGGLVRGATKPGAPVRGATSLVERGLASVLTVVGPGGVACAAADLAASATGRRAAMAGTPTAPEAPLGVDLDLDALCSIAAPDRVVGAGALVTDDRLSMLAVVPSGSAPRAIPECAAMGVTALEIGRLTDEATLTVSSSQPADGADAGRGAGPSAVLARIPLATFDASDVVVERRADPPRRRRQAPAPGAPIWAPDRLPIRGMDPGAVLRGLLGSPQLGRREHLFGPFGAATAPTVATFDVPGGLTVACATDGAAGLRALDPRLSAAFAIASSARSLALAGARPVAVSVSLQSGDPAIPEAFWLLSEAMGGLAEASRGLGLTVAAVGVRFADDAGPQVPSTHVAVVGEATPGLRRPPGSFVASGDHVGLLGASVPGLAGSAYAALAGAAADERLPSLDVDRELALQRLLLDATGEGILSGARPVGGGGVAVALAVSSIEGGVGARLSMRVSAEPAVELFGESPSRAVVTVRDDARSRLEALANAQGVPVEWLGRVGGERLQVDLVGGGAAGAAEERGASVADPVDCSVAELRHAWEHALDRLVTE